jgi:DNA-binding phage protein
MTPHKAAASRCHDKAMVEEKAGILRERLQRALSPNGNPTIKNMLAVLGAVGLQLAVTRQPNALAHA